MDYTIIGASANLAARLQPVAQPNSILMSVETAALVKDIAVTRPLAPTTLKGMVEPVVPHVFDRMIGESESVALHEQEDGLVLHLDLARIDPGNAARVQAALQRAVVALASHPVSGA